jgi:hypothetical protein
MEIEERKKFLETALINSFVEEYDAYKKTVNFINNDLSEYNINFQYTYDEFCISFLNETLKNAENSDIFSFNDFGQFYINFWKFNLYNLQCMLTTKLEELGYKYEDFYNKSNIKKRISDNYEHKTNNDL